jgi:hypothetical protein
VKRRLIALAVLTVTLAAVIGGLAVAYRPAHHHPTVTIKTRPGVDWKHVQWEPDWRTVDWGAGG